MQFIAKNKDIMIIECNVRASRSFPFVSKATGVDLINLSTRAMMDLPLEPYPKGRPGDLKLGHVAVKVPLFSFSRLAGADPVLGVEMASTGEVACFGADRYEAYMKGLLATGFRIPPPRSNILLSIGSYREKKEFLPSVRRLEELGFVLYATPGSAEYFSAEGVNVRILETQGGTEEESLREGNSEVERMLQSNKIALFICLPSKNTHRRPAQFMSRGYITRRMAVDFQVPLVTDVKCAKMIVEALGRFPTVDSVPVTRVDVRSTNVIVRFAAPVRVLPEEACSAKAGFSAMATLESTPVAHVDTLVLSPLRYV
jgi:carbamoyl-phosphate synthase / aspartate carbamoyltransferase